MKSVAIVFVLLAGVFANAEFKSTRVVFEYTHTPAETTALEAKYPHLFASVPTHHRPDLSSATVVFKEKRWYGPTICSANDPRLSKTFEALASYCITVANGATSCSSSAEIHSPQDPCL